MLTFGREFESDGKHTGKEGMKRKDQGIQLDPLFPSFPLLTQSASASSSPSCLCPQMKGGDDIRRR